MGNSMRNTDIKLTEPLMEETEIQTLKTTNEQCTEYEEILNGEEAIEESDDLDIEHKENSNAEQNSDEYMERNTFLNHLSSLKLGTIDTNATTLTYRTHSFSVTESEQTDVSSMSDADVPMLDILRRYMEEHCAENDTESKQVMDLFIQLQEEEYDTESVFCDIENATQSNIHSQCDDSVYWELSLYLKCQRLD